MKNRAMLEWLFSRMVEVHGENQNIDYMRRFRVIINHYDDIEDNKLSTVKTRNKSIRYLAMVSMVLCFISAIYSFAYKDLIQGLSFLALVCFSFNISVRN